MLEDRLAGLERGLEANTNNVKQLGDNVAVFKNIDISQLQSLPPRVDALEHFMEDSKHFMEETKHFMDDTRHFMDDTKHFIEDSKNFMDDTKHFMEDTKHFMDESTQFMEATKHFMEDSQHFMEDTKNFMDDADKERQERDERERADKERLEKERFDKERADALKAGLPPPPPPPPPAEVPKAPESPKRRSSYVPDLATIQMLKDGLEALCADFKAQSQKVTNLESQYDQLKELLQQTHKANSLDLESLQKSLRTLRSDFDSKPFLDLNLAGIKSGDKTAASTDLSTLEAMVADLQRRIQRKADNDDVEQLLRASDVSRERRGSVVSDRLDNRCKKIEDDLAALEAKLADKVDGSMLDELRFKVTVVEGKQAEAAKQPQQPPAPRRDSESILIRLKGLIANKVDRDEFLQLHVLLESKSGAAGGKTSSEKGGEEGLELELQGQRSETMKESAAAAQLLHMQARGSEANYKELREDLDKLMREMQGLSERSDLAVLLARRADNLVQPVASLPDGTGGTGRTRPPQDDEAIAKVINDHADRITEYSDMLLQMETLMSSKADMAGLQALKAAIIDLQKRKQSRMSGVLNLQQLKQPETIKEIVVSQEMVVSEETIKKHDMLLTQLSKNVELLNQATMTMSGHELPQMMLDGDFGSFPNGQEEAASERRSSVRFHGDQNEGQIGGVRPATAPTYDLHAGTGPAVRPSTAAISRPASAPNGKGSGTTSMDDDFPDDFDASLAHESPGHLGRPTSRPSHVMQDLDGHQFGSETHDLGSDATAEDYENYAAARALEDALRAHKIEPKENISKLVKWAREIQRLAADLNMLRTFMQDGLALKCDKSEHQRLAKLVKDFIARMDGEKAMLSGKPLIGFRCMSCDHPLEKLLHGRADHVPTNLMPKSCLPMLSAERIFGRDRREESPPRSPPSGDYTRAVSKKSGYDQVKERKPAAANLRRVSSAGQTKRPQQPRQEI